MPYWTGYTFAKPLDIKAERLDKITNDIMNRFNIQSTRGKQSAPEIEDDFALLFEWTNQLDADQLGDYRIA